MTDSTRYIAGARIRAKADQADSNCWKAGEEFIIEEDADGLFIRHKSDGGQHYVDVDTSIDWTDDFDLIND